MTRSPPAPAHDGSATAPVPPPGPSPALVAGELARIERSSTFRRSPLHRRLLRYLVTRTLAGDAARLKESVIAVEVFGRDPARFDPRHDTSVRVEARRLRQKLERFYVREGDGAAVAIRLAAGGYVPAFERRPDAAEALASLVVLPFVNLSGEAALDAWCDSLTEELIDALVQVPGMKVVARTTSFGLRGRSGDVRAIAREVGVARLVEGSVQARAGGRRVVAQLIDGASGLHLWSHAFESDAGADLAAVVHALARAVARSLARNGAGASLDRAAQRLSAKAEARELYFRAKYLMGRHTPASYRDAAALYGEAVAADPAFALAWAGKAHAAIGLHGMSATPDGAAIAQARNAVAKALALDPELGEAHAAAATLAFAADRDFERAERASLEAIRCAPSRAYVHHSYAWTLMFAGRFAEAGHEFDVARELDPLDPMLRVHQALLAFYRRDFGAAARRFAQVAADEPANLVARVLHASALLGAGAPDEALALFEAIARDLPGDSIGPLGVVQAHAVAGRAPQAREALDAAVTRLGAERFGPYRMAIAHARLGEAGEAFAWLDRAAAARDLNLVCLAVDPSFDALRDDARWPEALARYGLPAIDPRRPPAGASAP